MEASHKYDPENRIQKSRIRLSLSVSDTNGLVSYSVNQWLKCSERGCRTCFTIKVPKLWDINATGRAACQRQSVSLATKCEIQTACWYPCTAVRRACPSSTRAWIEKVSSSRIRWSYAIRFTRDCVVDRNARHGSWTIAHCSTAGETTLPTNIILVARVSDEAARLVTYHLLHVKLA